MSRYADVHLDDATAEDIRTLVDAITAQVVNILRHEQLDEPICSVCLYQGQEEELDVLPRIFAGRSSDRARIVDESPDDWAAAWNAFVYRDEEDVIHPSFAEDDEEEAFVSLAPAIISAWQRVRDALADRTEEPAYWVLGRVARQLNRTPLPGPVTDDVVVWLFEEDFEQAGLIEQLSFVLPSARYTALEVAGLIGQDDEASR